MATLDTSLIPPFQPGYSLTKTLFNKESSSEYTIVKAAAKVVNVVAAVLISIGETFLNVGKLILNIPIAPINFIHGLFSDKPSSKTPDKATTDLTKDDVSTAKDEAPETEKNTAGKDVVVENKVNNEIPPIPVDLTQETPPKKQLIKPTLDDKVKIAGVLVAGAAALLISGYSAKATSI